MAWMSSTESASVPTMAELAKTDKTGAMFEDVTFSTPAKRNIDTSGAGDGKDDGEALA